MQQFVLQKILISQCKTTYHVDEGKFLYPCILQLTEMEDFIFLDALHNVLQCQCNISSFTLSTGLFMVSRYNGFSSVAEPRFKSFFLIPSFWSSSSNSFLLDIHGLAFLSLDLISGIFSEKFCSHGLIPFYF